MMQPSERTFLNDAFQKMKHTVWYVLLFSFVMNVMMLILPLYSLQTIDRVLSSGSVETLIMLTVLAVGAFVLYGVFSALRSFILNRVASWLDSALAPEILASSIAGSALSVNSGGSQNIRNLSTIKSFLTGPGINALFDAPWAPIYFFIIYAINPAVGAIALVGGVLLLLMALLTEVTTKKPLDSAHKHLVQSMKFTESANRNAEIIESMGMMSSVVNYWKELNKKVLYLQSVAGDRSGVISSLSRVVRMLIQIAVIGTGGYLAINNEITVGGLIAGSILTGRALAPFEAAIGTWKSFIAARDAYKNLDEAMAETPRFRGTMNMPAPTGEIKVENLVFRPKNSDTIVLKGLNFRIAPGDSVGVIGPSAAGKSTLAKMMVGIWPATQGAVRMDGVDVYKWNREDFGKYVGYLPQEVELFVGTVRDNIARLDPTATDEEVVEAAQFAGVHDMILKLPQGYETVAGERTTSLSPGQRQRIGLARAMFRKPKLLVLDEPNSNLDGEGEHALIRAVQTGKAMGMTVVMVAHKPSLVANVEKVLALKNGKVEAFGARDEILQKFTRGGAGVAKLARSQTSAKEA